jgi:hypothetical protein
MKTTKTFENASLVSVVNGSIVVKSAAGIEHTFTNASVISVNNGTIIIESEWEPKEGELVKITGNCIDAYSIFHRHDKSAGTIVVYGSKLINGDDHEFGRSDWFIGSQTEIHPVTPAEQQAFDDFCKSQGKIWNKEKLQWEKYRWKPDQGTAYFHIFIAGGIVRTNNYIWTDDAADKNYYEMGNCFKTKEEAEAKLEQIKQILNR